MKKKTLAIILTFLIVFSMVSCNGKGRDNDTKPKADISSADTKNVQENSSVSTPYFWKVSGNGFDGEFYLLGSIHIGDKNTNTYPDEITDAFDDCEYLAVESDVIAIEKDFSLQVEMTKAIMYMDGSDITEHIDNKVYEEAREILKEYGFYNNAFDMLQPIYWMILIENAYISETDYSDKYGVDRHFLNLAKDEDKSILEIENAVETYEALASLGTKTQEFLLKEIIVDDYLEEYVEGTKELYSVWKKGDIKGSEELFDESAEGMTDEETEMYNEYNDLLLNDRNEGMVDAAVSYLESDKDVFYVVGLAHMIGENNIIDSLTAMGYTVTQVKYEL